MGIAKLADDSPQFVDGAFLSATALNMLRRTALAIDEASRLDGAMFAGSYGHRPEFFNLANTPIWRGGIVYLTGMTTLRVVTHTTGTVRSGDTLRVCRGDDDTVASTFAISAGTQTHTVTISGAGYAHGQALRVRCYLDRSIVVGGAYTGPWCEVVLVEALPVALAGWPGLPTITTAADITAANLNAIGAALNWLVRRLALRHDPLFVAIFMQIGPFWKAGSGSNMDVMWRGGVRRTTLHDGLRARGLVEVVTTGNSERIRSIVDGTETVSFPVPDAIGSYVWVLDVPLSALTPGTAHRIEIQYLRDSGTGQPTNRWTLSECYTYGSDGTVAALSRWDLSQPSVSPAALVSWLQTLITIISAAYARITTGNDGLWAVQRAYCARHAANQEQFEVFEPWEPTMLWARAGEALVLRGRGLTLGYGSWRYTGDLNPVRARNFESLKNVPLISGNTVESTRFYLDSAPGLSAGAAYLVRGVDLFVAFEQLRVVEDA